MPIEFAEEELHLIYQLAGDWMQDTEKLLRAALATTDNKLIQEFFHKATAEKRAPVYNLINKLTDYFNKARE